MKKVLPCRQESLHKGVEQPKCKTSATLDSVSAAQRAKQLFGGLRLGKRTQCTQQQHRATKPQFQTSITEFKTGGRRIFAAVTASLGFRQFEQPRRNSKDSRHSKPEGTHGSKSPKKNQWINEISNYSFGITKHWLPLNALKLRIWSKCAAATCANKKSWLSSACISIPWYAILVVTVLKICRRRPPHHFFVFPPNNRGMSPIFCVSKLLPPHFAYDFVSPCAITHAKPYPKILAWQILSWSCHSKHCSFFPPPRKSPGHQSNKTLHTTIKSVNKNSKKAEQKQTTPKPKHQHKRKHNSQTCKKGEQVTHEVKK